VSDGRGFVSVRVVWALAVALLVTAGRLAAAQELKLYSEILPDGAATVGPDWAELVFPPLELSNTGCFRADSFPPYSEPMRAYGWGAQTRFVDAFTGPTDHFTTLGVGFLLPARAPLTDARLDSALAVADLRVMEHKGEPPGPIDIVTPQRAWARRDGRRVRIRIERKEAVAALMRPRGDSIDLRWCRRNDTTHVFPSRTRIVGGTGIAPKVPHYTTADTAALFAAAVDAILAEDSSASHTELKFPIASGRDPHPTVFVRIGHMPEERWAAPSIERLRRWRWRILGWAVDSTNALAKRGGHSPQDAPTAVPLEITMFFYMPSDTAEFTEVRMFRTCKVRPGGSQEIWWISRLFTVTPSGWKQIRTKSTWAHADCR
jgi:hypothetical protein